jgi:hypothetical protein
LHEATRQELLSLLPDTKNEIQYKIVSQPSSMNFDSGAGRTADIKLISSQLDNLYHALQEARTYTDLILQTMVLVHEGLRMVCLADRDDTLEKANITRRIIENEIERNRVRIPPREQPQTGQPAKRK